MRAVRPAPDRAPPADGPAAGGQRRWRRGHRGPARPARPARPAGPRARHAADQAREQALARAEQGSAGLPVAVQEPAHGQKKGPGLERGTGPGFSAWSGAGVQKQQGSSPMQQAAPATQQAAPAANTWTEVLNSNTADSDFRILAFMTTSRN